jgi:hypothetical protein
VSLPAVEREEVESSHAASQSIAESHALARPIAGRLLDDDTDGPSPHLRFVPVKDEVHQLTTELLGQVR